MNIHDEFEIEYDKLIDMKSKGEDTSKQEIKVHELWKKVESK